MIYFKKVNWQLGSDGTHIENEKMHFENDKMLKKKHTYAIMYFQNEARVFYNIF